MNILEELNSVLGGLGLPLETGVFSGKAPDEYLVIVPISDGFGYHADNTHWSVRSSPLPIEGTSVMKPKRGITTMSWMPRKTMNWRINYNGNNRSG